MYIFVGKGGLSMVSGGMGISTGTVKVGKISPLNHEIGYNAMEFCPSIGGFDNASNIIITTTASSSTMMMR